MLIAVALSEATGPASYAALFLLVSFCYAMSKLAGTVKAIYRYFTIAASLPLILFALLLSLYRDFDFLSGPLGPLKGRPCQCLLWNVF